MCVTTINLKRDKEFESEWGGAYGKVWNEEMRGEMM